VQENSDLDILRTSSLVLGCIGKLRLTPAYEAFQFVQLLPKRTLISFHVDQLAADAGNLQTDLIGEGIGGGCVRHEGGDTEAEGAGRLDGRNTVGKAIRV